MSIEINGQKNTIKKIADSKNAVYVKYSLYINGVEYEWREGEGGEDIIIPAEPTDDIVTTQYTATFELWSPSQTAPESSANIPIKQGGAELPIYVKGKTICVYEASYTEGETTYTGDVVITTRPGVRIKDDLLTIISLADGGQRTSFRLYEYYSQNSMGLSGFSKRSITFEYEEEFKKTYAVKEVRVVDDPHTISEAVTAESMEVGNTLGVYGSINDLILEYNIEYINSPVSDIGFGFYALFYDTKVNDKILPNFQLSPGMIFTYDNIIVEWKANGVLSISSPSEDIHDISAAPHILRYE